MKPWDWVKVMKYPEDAILIAMIHLALMDLNSSNQALAQDARDFLLSQEIRDILDILGLSGFLDQALAMADSLTPTMQTAGAIPVEILRASRSP